jgi:hypothetical protein
MAVASDDAFLAEQATQAVLKEEVAVGDEEAIKDRPGCQPRTLPPFQRPRSRGVRPTAGLIGTQRTIMEQSWEPVWRLHWSCIAVRALMNDR